MERRAVKFQARVLCGFLAVVCLAAAPGARALQTRASSSLATEAKNLRTRADRAFQSQKNPEALELYLRAYPAYEEDFEVNRRIGRLYFISRKKGEWRKALPYLRQAHASRPGDMEVLHWLALVTAWSQNFEESLPLYRALLGSAPEVKAYRLEFARALRWAGQVSESAKYYGYYLDQSPSDLKVRLELAKMLAEGREFAGAIDQYQYVLRFQPENDVARLGLAKTLTWSGNYQASQEQVERILQSKPKDYDARLVRALNFLWMGWFEEAEVLFRELDEEDPKNKDVGEALEAIERRKPSKPKPEPPKPEKGPAPLQLAERHQAKGRFPEAISNYRAHLEKNPQDDAARFKLARVLGWNKQYEESETILREWVARNPENPEGIVQLARVLRWSGKYAESARYYRRALSFRDDDPALHIELAKVLSWTGAYPEALGEYEAVLRGNPENKEARFGRVQVLIWAGKFRQARQRLEEFPETQDPQWARLRESLQAAESGHVQALTAEGKEETLREFVEQEPKNVEARLALANLLTEKGDLPGAIQELRAAANLKPDDGRIHLRLAKTHGWNREFPEAIRLYRQWLDRNPDDQSVRLELARVLSWAKNYQESLQEFDALLERSPNYAEALVGKGRVFSYQSRWAESLKSYEAALAVEPENRDAKVGRAQTLLWSGRTRPAEKILKELLDEKPDDTTVLVSMASAENRSGRPEAALDLLARAEVLDPRNPDVGVLRGQIKSEKRPELLVGASYVRDTERLNIWRYRIFDLRFQVTPRFRSFIALEELPSSGPADVFGYPVTVAAGTGPCPVTQIGGCTVFAPRVPVDGAVAAPTVLSGTDFPPEILLPASERIRQAALQFRAGGTMRVNDRFQWTAGIGAVEIRHGSPDLSSAGFPSRRTRFIYDISPSFRFNRSSSLRLTLDASRRFYATTPRTLAQTTHVDEQSAQLVWTPNSRSQLSLRLYHRILSPPFQLPTVGSFTARRFQKKGNGGAARAVRTVWKTDRAELALGYEGNVYGYSHPDGLPTPEFFANPGFFAPGFYQRHAGLVQPTLKPADFFAWRLYGTFGFQQIGQGSERGFSSTAGTELEFRLSERTALSLGYDYFNAASAGRQVASAGKALSYHSNSVTAGLRYRF